MEFHPVEIPGCAPKSLWKFSACGDNRELSMLSSRSNQLVTTPPPSLPLLFNGLWVTGMNGWKFALALPRWPPMLQAQKKRRGKKKGKKMQRTNKYLHPHRITGRRNIHPPYTSIFPRASIPLLSKHLQFPYYFPRRVSCFVTCRQTEILPPPSPY